MVNTLNVSGFYATISLMQDAAGPTNSIKKQKPMKKLIIPGIVIVLLLLIGGGIFWQQQAERDNASPTPSPDSITNPTDSNVNKIDYSPSDPSANDEINQRKDSGSVAPTPPSNTGISATITRADVSPEGILQVRVLISGSSEGTCTARLTKGEGAITKEVPVIIKGTFVTCDGFDIPKGELTSGEWQLAITVTNTNGTSSPATQAVQIN